MYMAEAFEKMVDAISANVPPSDNEYIGEDGLLHCSVCHRKTQTKVEFLGIKKIVRCICDCKNNEINEQVRREKIREWRKDCFSDADMREWCFENDDRQKPELSNAMVRYTELFDDYLKKGKGLLLYGPVGTGKSYYAACVANRLMEKGYRAKFTNFPTLINQIQSTYEGKQAIIDGLNRYPLLIIDDLGVERSSEYMQETVFNIIDSRIRFGKPMIITTNLTAEQIKKPADVTSARIYDRLVGKFIPVEVGGISRRRQALKESFAEDRALLGL